jgi:3-oxoacyl-[acyl-carrier protein] reductase
VTTNLEGRRILITGAATGIGLAALRTFAAAGAQLAAVFRSSPPPEDVARSATWTQCDLTDRDAVFATFDAAAAKLGGLDVLLHCAGVWAPATPSDLAPEDLAHSMAANLDSTVFTNQAAYAHMRTAGGAIINIGSSEGVAGSPISVHYAMAKGAVHTWTRSAARAWGPDRVTVNAVAPCVDTTNANRLREHLGRGGEDGDALLAARMKALIPLGGAFGDAERDLAPVLAFLSSDDARFITGQLIAVDGGMRMLGA